MRHKAHQSIPAIAIMVNLKYGHYKNHCITWQLEQLPESIWKDDNKQKYKPIDQFHNNFPLADSSPDTVNELMSYKN